MPLKKTSTRNNCLILKLGTPTVPVTICMWEPQWVCYGGENLLRIIYGWWISCVNIIIVWVTISVCRKKSTKRNNFGERIREGQFKLHIVHLLSSSSKGIHTCFLPSARRAEIFENFNVMNTSMQTYVSNLLQHGIVILKTIRQKHRFCLVSLEGQIGRNVYIIIFARLL